MRSLGFDVKKAEALALMDEHDVVGTGYIGYDEFLDIMARRIAERSPEEELRKAFELFDEDATGRISLRNLRHVVKELGENLSDDELQAMIEVRRGGRPANASPRLPAARAQRRMPRHATLCCEASHPPHVCVRSLRRSRPLQEFDTDGDKEISLEDFAAIMKSTSLYD
jgi:Ca2+-binding EF-hand superfamily protein